MKNLNHRLQQHQTRVEALPTHWAGKVGIMAFLLLAILLLAQGAAMSRLSVIVQAESMDAAEASVNWAGGTITHRLDIINAVGATLTPAQWAVVQAQPQVTRLSLNSTLEVAGKPQPDAIMPTLIGADRLHTAGITGQNVTVAVLDTGTMSHKDILKTASNTNRLLATYNAMTDNLDTNSSDGSGHGTHITSIIVSSGRPAKTAYITAWPRTPTWWR